MEIANTVVGFVSIAMINLIPIRAWPQKGGGNKCVNVILLPDTVGR